MSQVRKTDEKTRQNNVNRVNAKGFRTRKNIVQGQFVLKLNDQKTRKFDPLYEAEPYLVTNVTGDLLHLLRLSDNRTTKRHVSHVKLYVKRMSPKSAIVDGPADNDFDDIDIGQPNTALVIDADNALDVAEQGGTANNIPPQDIDNLRNDQVIDNVAPMPLVIWKVVMFAVLHASKHQPKRQY